MSPCYLKRIVQKLFQMLDKIAIKILLSLFNNFSVTNYSTFIKSCDVAKYVTALLPIS